MLRLIFSSWTYFISNITSQLIYKYMYIASSLAFIFRISRCVKVAHKSPIEAKRNQKTKINVKLFLAFQITKAWTRNKSNNDKLNVICITKSWTQKQKRSQTVNLMLSSFFLDFFFMSVVQKVLQSQSFSLNKLPCSVSD